MTKRKLSKEHLEKLKKGRQKRLEKIGLVCTIGNHIEVWADTRQFILKIEGHSDTYYPTIKMLLDELLELKIRELATEQTIKELKGINQALDNLYIWHKNELKRSLGEYLEGRFKPIP